MNPKWVVDANYRYIATSQEVNARIAQRHQALTLYVSLVVSLLAALVALKPGEGRPAPPVEWLLLGFPVASLCLTLLNIKAERALTNLRHFLGSLERLNNRDGQLPGYNTEPHWSQRANRARRFQDFTAVILVTGGNAMAAGAVLEIYPVQMAAHPWSLALTVSIALAAVITLLLIPRGSYRPHLPDED